MSVANDQPRKLRVCYLNVEPYILDSSRIALEKKLKLLGELEIVSIKNLQDPKLFPCDLLVLAAQKIPEAQFPRWLDSLSDKVQAQGQVWVPALIFAEVGFSALQQILQKAAKMNWYFDVIGEDQLASLPIRVANLLKIHDHLHELKRYEATLTGLNQKIDKLVQEFSDFNSGTLKNITD